MLEKLNLGKQFRPVLTQNKSVNIPISGSQACDFNNENEVKTPLSALRAYSLVNFKGKIDISNDIQQEKPLTADEISDLMSKTLPDEEISLQDTIKLLSQLNLAEKTMGDFILGASYDLPQEELRINKLAVLNEMLLKTGAYPVQNGKIPQAIASAFDYETLSFSQERFERLFNQKGALKFSAKLASPRKDHSIEGKMVTMTHKSMISQAIKNHNKVSQDFVQPVEKLNIDNIFMTFDDIKKEFFDVLNNVKNENNCVFSEDLYNSLKNEISKCNFDIKSIYNKHYAGLSECKTLDDVKRLYPEIPVPEVQTIRNRRNGISKRIAAEGYDNVAIDIIKKIYLDFQKQSDIIVDLPHSYPTDYYSIKTAGYDFGCVPKEIISLKKRGESLLNEFKNLEKVPQSEIELAIKQRASRKSRVWVEYRGITNRYWTKVPAIMHKRHHPDTTFYQTDKLVEGYLYNLYKQNPEKDYDPNPIAQYADDKPFDNSKKKALEELYLNYWNVKKSGINSKEFKEFKSKFDLKAMGNSVEKLERHYKNAFFNWFYTPERKQKYRNAVEESYKLVADKMEFVGSLKKFNKPEIKKVINDEITEEALSDYMYEDDSAIVDNENKALTNSFNKYRAIVSKCADAELKSLFKTYIGCSEKDFDADVLKIFVKYADEDVAASRRVDFDKSKLMILLHRQYLENVLSSKDTNIEECDYFQNFLEPFIAEDGKLDVKNALDKIKKS